jgi:diguanylate cyclase (GGDEF)-like protein
MQDLERQRLLDEIEQLKKQKYDLQARDVVRMEDLLKRRLEFENTVSIISSRFMGDIDLDQAIETSLQDMGLMRKAIRAYIFMFSEDGKTLNNTHEWCSEGAKPQKETLKNLPVSFFPIGIDRIKKGEVVHVKTASRISEEDIREELECRGIKSILLLPLKINGQIAGFIGFDSTIRTTDWTDEDVSMLRVGTEVIGRALERKDQEREIKRQMHNFSIIYDVGKALNFVEDLTRFLSMLLDKAIDITWSQKGSLMLYDEGSNELVTRIVRGLDPRLTEKIMTGEIKCKRIKKGEGAAGKVFETGMPLIINDIKDDPIFVEREKSWAENILCVPLKVYDEAIGVINITNKRQLQHYTEEDIELVLALANQAATAINNARLYEMAITDGLTKVLIRRHFLKRLEDEIRRSKRYNHKLSLIMADFDNFKEINDTYGHQAGDRVLNQVGEVLRKSVRSSDFVGRYGGEEFCITLTETPTEGALVFANRLGSLIGSTEFSDDNFIMRRTISIGVATFPDHAADLHELIKCADLALYKAKRDGRNKTCSYDEVQSYERSLVE